ncbi:cysteine desulfurase family protein [Leptotrichia buccalis]|uniref:Aminotransferase class V n=1 Tax=Leptotrichia buccalis (strain ATCC 14201 / DSM 1135 / JCM 12969 / NCTC 10249 / C-1013-b) TaxID=523794 RepID=C7NEK9_LEPBD|nr:cysteine desulfurase family protein [Leptotrichia buccalis]ACV38370.1 aminotransferase class V [Leptotrichia buccalis C-1013-b]
MKIVYLDNAATTKMSDKVINEMTKSFSENYGNPSSVHTLGQRAKSTVENARHIVAKNLKAETTEIVFTSGGAEGNNLVIRGFLKANKDKEKHIITSKIEHSTILKTFEQLEKEGYEVSYIGVNETGVVDIEELKRELREDTALVSIMFVNNETGVIQLIKEIGEILAERNIFFHTDAVQAIGKLKILPKDLKINALTATAHKFYGPKGAGFVFIDKKYSVEKEIWGGSQERNRRAGTENVHGILGLGVALEEVYENLEEISEKENKLQNYLENKLKIEIEKLGKKIKINGEKANRIKTTTNVYIEGVDIQMLLVALDLRGICISGGSACMSGSLENSHVLKAMGLTDEELKGSFRISIGKDTTIEEIDYFVENLIEVIL